MSAPAKKLDDIREVLKRIDVPRQQVYIEAKILQLSGNDASKIAKAWAKRFPAVSVMGTMSAT